MIFSYEIQVQNCGVWETVGRVSMFPEDLSSFLSFLALDTISYSRVCRARDPEEGVRHRFWTGKTYSAYYGHRGVQEL